MRGGPLLTTSAAVENGMSWQMPEDKVCSIEDCVGPAVALLSMKSFCREHFITTSYRKLEAYGELIKERRLSDVTPESVRRFIYECLLQADQIEQSARDLNNQDRDRLLQIILLTADVGRHVRRSPRKAISIPVLVSSLRPEPPWEEETETLTISRHGALVRCNHRLEADQRFRVVRLDNGQQARARVAWYPRNKERPTEVAIEFLDCDNFWGMDWSTIETSA